MSAETLSALEDALQAHIASETEDGMLVTGWVTYIAGEHMSDPSQSFYRAVTSGRQPYHSTLGLVRMLYDEYNGLPWTDDDADD